MSNSAWGRWGEDDERGALNLIGSKEILAATALIREGITIQLGQPLSSKTRVPDHRPTISHSILSDGTQLSRSPTNDFKYSDDAIYMPLHSGTHIDALCHVWYGDDLYNGYPATAIDPIEGATRCGVDKLGSIIGRGVLIDLTQGGNPLPPGTAISRITLEKATTRDALELLPGDIVLLRTGWSEIKGLDPSVYFSSEPGIDISAADWLKEHEVAAVGADNYALEVIPFQGDGAFPVHRFLLHDCGIPIMEELALAELSLSGRTSFFFVALPLAIKGGTGSPICPTVIL